MSFYYFLIGLWFRLLGQPHMPSWLAWQGLAAGLLTVAVYWFGVRLANRAAGLVAAGLVAADHVMLHLMGTLNMEVLAIPSLYLGLWAWVSAREAPAPQRLNRCAAAGALLGLSTLFRPTAGLIPPLLVALMALERPRLPWRECRAHAVRLMAGLLPTMAVLLIRNRLVWDRWTLGQSQSQGARLSWRANYAWDIQGQHAADIGLGPWLKLLAADPSVIWREMIPDWTAQILVLWTHIGFGQMDLIQGLNRPGAYQASLATILTVLVALGGWVALRRRTRADLVVVALPLYFTTLALVYWVINTRYRAPFLPALYLLACLGFHSAVTAIRSSPAPTIGVRPQSRISSTVTLGV